MWISVAIFRRRGPSLFDWSLIEKSKKENPQFIKILWNYAKRIWSRLEGFILWDPKHNQWQRNKQPMDENIIKVGKNVYSTCLELEIIYSKVFWVKIQKY